MKTVYLTRDYNYRASTKRSVRFQAGQTYRRVIEACAVCIVRAGAGHVLDPAPRPGDVAGSAIDARPAFEPHRRRAR